MNSNTLRIGILGAGHIAEKMAMTIAAMSDVMIIAVASRSLERAQNFATRFAIERAYDSYETLVSDPDFDLIYVATPHSHHYPHARLALEHDKAVLLENAFTANAGEAAELIRLAHERGVFLTESPMMPHTETLAIMQQMDALRAEWGVCYPMD